MSDHDEHTRNRGVFWAWLLVVLMLLYPLSMGPFWGLREHGVFIPGSPVERFLVGFYAPLEELAQAAPPFKALLKAYLGLFAPV